MSNRVLTRPASGLASRESFTRRFPLPQRLRSGSEPLHRDTNLNHSFFHKNILYTIICNDKEQFEALVTD